MQKLIWKNHTELGAEMGMINLTEFSLPQTVADLDELIEAFIRSDYYEKDCRNDYVKANPNGGFLPGPFVLNNIYYSDFRKFDKDQFQKYIYEYRDNGMWYDQEKTIRNLVNGFYRLYPDFNHEVFYVLNKEWFEPPKGKYNLIDFDSRLQDGVWWRYSFFMLIIWFDSIENTLTVSEWYCD